MQDIQSLSQKSLIQQLNSGFVSFTYFSIKGSFSCFSSFFATFGFVYVFFSDFDLFYLPSLTLNFLMLSLSSIYPFISCFSFFLKSTDSNCCMRNFLPIALFSSLICQIFFLCRFQLLPETYWYLSVLKVVKVGSMCHIFLSRSMFYSLRWSLDYFYLKTLAADLDLRRVLDIYQTSFSHSLTMRCFYLVMDPRVCRCFLYFSSWSF